MNLLVCFYIGGGYKMNNNNFFINYKKYYMTINIILLLMLSTFVSIGYSALNASFFVTGDLTYEGQTFYRLIANSSKGLDTNIDFSVAPTSSGVYKLSSTNNDKYPVYYYRGSVSNNHVKFAKFCWNIVRTTSTGGVKLIYNGEIASNGSCNNDPIVSTVVNTNFNSDYSSNDSASYVLADGTDSGAKLTVDQWYTFHMTGYTNKLEDTVWCNDKSVYEDNYDYSTGMGTILYGGYGRYYNTKKPTVVCERIEDSYTVTSNSGNKKLKYPAALLTIDEVMMAGEAGYLSRGQKWWIMTPGNGCGGSYGCARMFYFDGTYIDNSDPDASFGLRPSVSLIPGIAISGGNGTSGNPYVVS